MAEENDPLVADELVKVDRAGRGLGLEIRGGRAQAQAVTARVLAWRLRGGAGPASGRWKITYGAGRSSVDILNRNQRFEDELGGKKLKL